MGGAPYERDGLGADAGNWVQLKQKLGSAQIVVGRIEQ